MLRSRRDFLRAVAASAAAMAVRPASASEGFRLVAPWLDDEGGASLGLWTRHARPDASLDLPARVHAVTLAPEGRHCVAVARRPGRFGLSVDLERFEASQHFEAADGRHFFGHGAFADEGRLFVTSENDIEAGRGMVGVRDVRKGFRLFAEWPSGGVGPHDLALSGDGRSLWVANGGIDMSPDYGRAKLNEDIIVSALTRLDLASGQPQAVVRLGDDMASLSIRHIAVTKDGTVGFGCQETLRDGMTRPLVGAVGSDDRPRWFQAPPGGWQVLRGSIGEVALDDAGLVLAATAPLGGGCGLWRIADGACLGLVDLDDCCGLGGLGDGFVVSSGRGTMLRASAAGSERLFQAAGGFDNHLAVV
jgi:hypothetical protein